MESFTNFLRSFSQSFDSPQNQQQITEERRESSLSESGYDSQNSSRRSSDTNQAEKAQRMRKIRNQAREDDDEGDEAFSRRGRVGNHAHSFSSSSGGSSVAIGVGLAAFALGSYAIGKILFSSSTQTPKFSTTTKEIIEAIKKIEEDTKEYPVIGLDCQWNLTMTEGRRNKIALLQLCSSEGNLAIIPMNKIHTYPDELKNLLRNTRIIKAGVETIKDAKYLLEDYGLVVSSTYDIRYLAEDCGHQPLGLEKLAERILDIELGRDWELIASDWDKDNLDDNQKSYAEKSVKVSIDIFKTLIPYAISRVNRNEILNYCYEHVDRPFVYYSQRY
ncbi:hypothetical protein PVAND_000032 [Polypedilum vanderplanki]|uniref:3'-5' exonuclease domain-containing protein n=1 Tax=Polypedilum vanderplanki TaxID=319348 RepID=A0A9J6BJ44_POLVA|nr:hypothetical protein PVAND_000032 [Polypedilum vanderplanki]